MSMYERVAIRIYLIILGVAIPIYFLLFGASGHEINVPGEEILWMMVAVIALCLVLTYQSRQKKAEKIEGIVFVTLIGSLLLTIYAGGHIFWFMVHFNYDDEVVIPRILSYVVPVIFVVSNLIILVGAIRYQRDG